jgi:hypothetical protein
MNGKPEFVLVALNRICIRRVVLTALTYALTVKRKTADIKGHQYYMKRTNGMNPVIGKLTMNEIVDIWKWLGVERHIRVKDVLEYREWKLEVATLERWHKM